MRESATDKARRYLGEGRVIVIRVSDRIVSARVRGDGVIHDVLWAAGRWSCTCPVATDQCSHLKAVRMVVALDMAVVS